MVENPIQVELKIDIVGEIGEHWNKGRIETQDVLSFRGFRTIQYYKFQNSAILNVRAILS